MSGLVPESQSWSSALSRVGWKTHWFKGNILYYLNTHMGLVMRKPVFGVCDQLKTQSSLLNYRDCHFGFSKYMYYTIEAANNKSADQTVQVHRLICTFVVRMWHKQVFSWTWPILYWLGLVHQWKYCLFSCTLNLHEKKNISFLYSYFEALKQTP